jgi:uncharacterized OB-fold protein
MTADSQFFWDGVREHRLLIQRCAQCGAPRHPPRPMCPECQSLEWHTIESSGRGTVYSCVIPHHPPLPWFPEPYVVALIDLEEGTRIVSNVVGIAPDAVTVGLSVVVHYEHFDDDVVLPLFAPEPA